MTKNTMKRVFIAGASVALSYKQKNPNSSESEIMSHVTKEMEKTIRSLEDDE